MEEKTENKCSCDSICSECKGVKSNKISIYNGTFFDLFMQKVGRNFASMKFQWLLFLYIPVVYGMFTMMPESKPAVPWISTTLGLGFLGGGFITLATSRIIARTKLTEDTVKGLDTDR